MARAYSINNVLTAKFPELPFDGAWLEAVGKPQPTGTWFVYGPPKNGKTTFTMMLAKYMTNFKRVLYLPYEEGISLTTQMALERVQMREVGAKMAIGLPEPVNELMVRLEKHRSHDVVITDSIQFAGFNWEEYKRLKANFPQKIFTYISHIENGKPDGKTAQRIMRDANVVFRVEGFRAFPTGRYGGGKTIDIWPEKAKQYWGE